MSMSISGYGQSALQRFDLSQMKAQREQAIAKLKETDSDLADKLTKIDSRMDELREAGTDPKTAKQTIDSEFGKLSDKELGEIREAMGSLGGPGGMRRMQGPPPGPPPGTGGTDGSSEKSVEDLLKELSSALTDSSSDSSSSSTSSTTSSSSSLSSDTVWSDFRQLAQLLAQKYGSAAQSGYGQSYFGSQGLVA